MQSNKFIKPRNLWSGSRVGELTKARSFINDDDFEIELDKIRNSLDKYTSSIENSIVPTKDSYITFTEKQKLVTDTVMEIMGYFKNLEDSQMSQVHECLQKYITEYVTNYKNLLLDYGSIENIKNAIINKCCGIIDKNKKLNFVYNAQKEIKKVINKNGNTVILYTDNTLWGNGSNTYGQLGLGNFNPTGNTEFKKISDNVTDFTLEDECLTITRTKEDGSSEKLYSGNLYETRAEDLELRQIVPHGEFTDIQFPDNSNYRINFVAKTAGLETNKFYGLGAIEVHEQHENAPRATLNDDGTLSLEKPHFVDTVTELQTYSSLPIEAAILKTTEASEFCTNNGCELNSNKIIHIKSTSLVLDKLEGILTKYKTVNTESVCFYLYIKGNYTVYKNDISIKTGTSTNADQYNITDCIYIENLNTDTDVIKIESDNEFYITWFILHPKYDIFYYDIFSIIAQYKGTDNIYVINYEIENASSVSNLRCLFNASGTDSEDSAYADDYIVFSSTKNNTDGLRNFTRARDKAHTRLLRLQYDYLQIKLDASSFKFKIYSITNTKLYLTGIQFMLENIEDVEKIVFSSGDTTSLQGHSNIYIKGLSENNYDVPPDLKVTTYILPKTILKRNWTYIRVLYFIAPENTSYSINDLLYENIQFYIYRKKLRASKNMLTVIS